MNARRLSVLAILIALTASLAHAQPLTDRLPDSTIVYIGWSPSAAMQNTIMAKMMADERVTSPVRRMFQELVFSGKDPGAQGERISDHLPVLLETASNCEGCFALLDLKQGKKRLLSQSVIMLDLGAKRQAFEKHFAPIQNNLKERLGDRMRLMKLEKSWVYYMPDNLGKPQMTWGIVGDTFIMYFGEGSAQFVPKLVKGDIGPMLKAAPAFVDCVGKIPGDAVMTTYIDTRIALGLIKQFIASDGDPDLKLLSQNWDKLMGELGADNVKGLAEKTVIEDRQFVTRSLIRTEGAPKGFLPLIAQPAVDAEMFKAIPADAMAACAFRLDLAKTYDQIKTSSIKVVGDPAKDAFNEIEQGAAGMQIPVKDCLSALGDQWVIYNSASNGGFALTGWTLVVDIREKEKFNRVITVLRGLLAAGGQARIHEMNVDGVRIEYVRQGRYVPVTPAWAIVGNKLVVALYPQLVEDAAKQITGGGKSILDNPDYVAARKRTGDSGAMLWFAGPEVVKNLYPLGLLLGGFAESFGGFSDDQPHQSLTELLPSLQRLLQYVGNDAMSIKTTPDGILKTKSVGNPLLSPMAWLDTPAVWAAILVPAAGSASNQSEKVASAGNLRQVGMAMMLYANENKGAYPADLDTLVKKVDLSKDCLSSPFGPAKEGPDVAFVHFAGMTQKTVAADMIVAYDQAALEQGEGTNALYGDGHVEWLGSEDFKKALAETKKKAALNNAQP